MFRLRDPYLIYYYRKQLHILRSSIALTCTFLIITFFELPHSAWALVSTLMVMGNLPHVGGVLDKGGQRLLGTLLGALLGLLILTIPSPPGWLIPFLTLASIAIALFITFTGRFSYSALMFGITILMVVGAGNHDLTIALWRSFNVLIGTLIGIIVTALLLPQKATDLMRFLIADNIDKLSRLYHAHTTDRRYDDDEVQHMLKKITAQLVKQRNLIDPVHQEGRLKRGALEDIISLERRMISTVELLLETHWATRDGHDIIERFEGLRNEQYELATTLGTLGYLVKTGRNIDLSVGLFHLDRYADQAMTAKSSSGRALYSPAGYLWLNRELGRQSNAMITCLSNMQHLPSQRLRKRSRRHHLISTEKTLPVPEARPESTVPDRE
ncbi:FUSC family protein [Larsenimonas rhizosphaerae]|uniref:FUSC family protein n=1 Tax=Larsenimonas rhizosphaerae TaxID=2944682 RepID=A0AA42CX88_9GAMM|nr:FUSC family protein [Larsenimonas rhizosphaerae]MCM2130894.1 FUSC family protein [Larsenimonas rhizosphaerae]MCX2523598.1 FUSC family protein [Larsenimonas rhizosphaerae]